MCPDIESLIMHPEQRLEQISLSIEVDSISSEEEFIVVQPLGSVINSSDLRSMDYFLFEFSSSAVFSVDDLVKDRV